MGENIENREPRPLDNSWIAEIQWRSDEYDAGKVQPIPWPLVKKQARKAAKR